MQSLFAVGVALLIVALREVGPGRHPR